MYDISGKVLRANQALPLNKQISLQSLTSGIYMLALQIDGETVMRKIIKK